jgi:eukaryotic-like serine/threonine-protein kinase
MGACERCSASFDPGARFCGSCGAPAGADAATHAHADAAGAPDERDPWIGRVVDRRYRVVMRLGAGGMGVVYQVEHLHLGKKAAMKVLTPDGAAQPEMVRRFRNEAQAVSKLDHSNIVQTFDFGQCDGVLYLVMEYIAGDDLATVIRREGPWSFARAARLFVQVCAGLIEAHEAGIVHRDLKPENLMVVKRRDGAEHVKILDFGLAKLRERTTDSDLSSVSSGGQVIGTPYYMAPEQVRGEPLDARADLYSVGATLYRVLTGVTPFDAPSPMSVLAKHLTDDVVPPCTRAPERALPPRPIGSCCARWRRRFRTATRRPWRCAMISSAPWERSARRVRGGRRSPAPHRSVRRLFRGRPRHRPRRPSSSPCPSAAPTR